MNEALLKKLTDQKIINHLHYRETVSSTNTVAKELIEQGISDSALVVAEIQTAGKGRMGRSWSSPYGTGIWMSLLLRPTTDISKISGITLVSALAIANAIRDTAGAKASIKWPNDVIIGTRKVCGILTEMLSCGNDNYVICGIGINVNTREFPEELKDKATSILIETGTEICREELIISIMTYFMSYYREFEKSGNLSFMMDSYNSLLISRNKEVILTDANGSFHDNPYTALAINPDGALIVSDCNGRQHEICFGEVSVRGILGYV